MSTIERHPLADFCDLAVAGKAINDQPIEVRSAHCDYNAKGRCDAHWFRMVDRNGWEYFGERLQKVGALAPTRRQTVRGLVYPGELMLKHDRGGQVDLVWLIIGGEFDNKDNHVVKCDFLRTRDGQLQITLPDGQIVSRPDPRK